MRFRLPTLWFATLVAAGLLYLNLYPPDAKAPFQWGWPWMYEHPQGFVDPLETRTLDYLAFNALVAVILILSIMALVEFLLWRRNGSGEL